MPVNFLSIIYSIDYSVKHVSQNVLWSLSNSREKIQVPLDASYGTSSRLIRYDELTDNIQTNFQFKGKIIGVKLYFDNSALPSDNMPIPHNGS